jgi:hypothetical protein
VFESPKPLGENAARAGRRSPEEWRWRSEVGTTFACVRRRPLWFEWKRGISLEGLIFPEVSDGQP